MGRQDSFLAATNKGLSEGDRSLRSNGEANRTAPQAISPLRRACNHCRKQKLRCDAVLAPFSACSRCRRLRKTCEVERDFKPVTRREKHVEMQAEIDDLRRQLALVTQNKTVAQSVQSEPGLEAAPAPVEQSSRSLGGICTPGKILEELHSQYFKLYHPFLPFLDPELTMNDYFDLHPLLGWSIVMVAARRFSQQAGLFVSLRSNYVDLLWKTISEMPQSYHVVKALCLICFWPLPTSRDFKDQTYHLTGIMKNAAFQSMLHLPFPAQSPPSGSTKIEQQDRLMTWVTCNIVAQSAADACGLPSQGTYDWILGLDFQQANHFEVTGDLIRQLRIARFCHTVTESLYCSSDVLSGLIPSSESISEMGQLENQYLEVQLGLGDKPSSIVQLHLLAANVHLSAFAFFIPASNPTRNSYLLKLYNASGDFFQKLMEFEISTGTILECCSYHILQNTISSIGALLKLLSSPFSATIDSARGRAAFNAGLLAVAKMSIQEDDAAYRCATRVPVQWRVWGSGSPVVPDPTILRIAFRMSASHVYDIMWNWRAYLETHKLPANGHGPSLDNVAYGTSPSVLSQDESGNLINDPLVSGIDLNDLEIFNAMDWGLDDDFIASFQVGGQDNFF